jgi:hypothetical protein
MPNYIARRTHGLILRSRASRGVSKDGIQHDCFAPFETAAARPPQGEGFLSC